MGNGYGVGVGRRRYKGGELVSRTKVIVVGANGTLGLSVLAALGPDTAIAATRHDRAPILGFAHVQLGSEGCPPQDSLEQCRAVINVAGRVHGTEGELEAANVQLPLSIARAAATAGVVKMVQVSSFAVYGAVERVDAATPQRPINPYGQSKAKCDQALSSITSGKLAIESVRLPFIFSSTKPGLLSLLLKLADLLRILPDAAPNPVQRSMITYGSAARNLIECATSEHEGISHAADPQPFTYPLLASALLESIDRRVSVVGMPTLVRNVINRIVPGVGRRLLKSNLLDPQLNRAATASSDLETELRALLRLRYGQ